MRELATHMLTPESANNAAAQLGSLDITPNGVRTEFVARIQLHDKVEHFGSSVLSDSELLALVLHAGRSEKDALEVAGGLLAEAGSLANLTSWKETDFRRLKGIGRSKSFQLVAIAEIARRMHSQDRILSPQLGRADLVYSYFRPITMGLEVEKFWVLCLNRKNRLLKRVEVTSGTATNSLVHPREVFREAIRSGASAIICAHNHPSGDPSPSSADIQVTRQLREAAKSIAIDLLDHVVVGESALDPTGQGYYSFRSAGLL